VIYNVTSISEMTYSVLSGTLNLTHSLIYKEGNFQYSKADYISWRFRARWGRCLPLMWLVKECWKSVNTWWSRECLKVAPATGMCV